MSIVDPTIDPTLDPITGLPVGADYFTQYQIPLNSQPVNLTELNAQGRQNNWLYPDHIPPTLARLQARDLTNEGNAQDLSTDGQRNLNVNIAKSSIPSGGGGGPTPAKYNNFSAPTVGTLCHNNDTVFFDEVVHASVIYGVTFFAALDPNSTPVQRNVSYVVFLSAVSGGGIGMVIALGGWSIVSSGITSDLKGDSTRILFPVPIDRAKTWPTATSILISLQAEGGDIFCGGAAIVG